MWTTDCYLHELEGDWAKLKGNQEFDRYESSDMEFWANLEGLSSHWCIWRNQRMVFLGVDFTPHDNQVEFCDTKGILNVISFANVVMQLLFEQLLSIV